MKLTQNAVVWQKLYYDSRVRVWLEKINRYGKACDRSGIDCRLSIGHFGKGLEGLKPARAGKTVAPVTVL